MNRNQRKYNRPIQKTDNKAVDPFAKNDDVIHLPSKFRQKSPKGEKFQNNRCCHIRPVHQDESVITDNPVEYDPVIIIFCDSETDV